VIVEAETAESAALGLALSGGGVRAASFSLGVVIGLIETGCHRRVRYVASVSGGSILNAALAHARSLDGFSSVEEFGIPGFEAGSEPSLARCLCLRLELGSPPSGVSSQKAEDE
jgi:hypothetical protein